MIRSVLAVCAALLLATLSIYGLTSREPRADFRYVNPSGIHTLDPARMSWTQDFRVALNLWEGLTTWHGETTVPVEGAARFPPQVSADRLTYTFTIRQDARWSNGDAVTARDFIRGWRRGMEPGTATDYAFLFTDHINGAADYVAWRQKAVLVLTALARLGDGWEIDSKQARAIAHHPVCARWCENPFSHPILRESLRRRQDGNPVAGRCEMGISDEPGGGEPVPNEEADWEVLAGQLNGLDVDWDTLYSRVFKDHVSDLDARFAKVGIKALGDRTLVVKLARPCPYFLDLTAFPAFLPCHKSIELLRGGGTGFKPVPHGAPITAGGLVVYDPQWTKPDYRRNGYPGLVTNGPYRLVDWVFKRRARLSVNPYHRAAKTIACRTIDMLVYENISAAIMAYEAGDVDFLPAMDVPYDHEIARLARTGERPDFHLCVVLATYFLNFNCVSETVGKLVNPFVDPKVRKAFSLAIDKKAIVDNVLKRGDRVAHSFVPGGAIPGYEPPVGLTRNVNEARRLLAVAGYPGGCGLPPVEFLYVPSDERACQAIARMWEETLGVRVELRCKESKTFAEDKANHRYMIARGNWYADYNDATTFLNCLTTGNGNNDSGYSNPSYDDLLARASETREPAVRAALLRQAEAMIVEEDLPILPVLHYAAPIAIKPYVTGLYPNARLWFPFRYVTIER